MGRSFSLTSRPIPAFLRRAPPLSKPTDLDGAIRLLGVGPTVRLHLHESREIPAWRDHPRGALVALQGAIIDHRLSQKYVVVFKPPNFGDVHAAARTLNLAPFRPDPFGWREVKPGNRSTVIPQIVAGKWVTFSGFGLT